MTYTLVDFIKAGKHPEEKGFPESGFCIDSYSSQLVSTKWKVASISNGMSVTAFEALRATLTTVELAELCSKSGFEEVSTTKLIKELIESEEDLTELHNAVMDYYFDREFPDGNFQGSYLDEKGNEWLLNFGSFSLDYVDEEDPDAEFEYSGIRLELA